MSPISIEKFERFKKRIEDITTRLQKHGSLRVQLVIDDSYYMQKKEELHELELQWQSARRRLDEVEKLVATHYKSTYCRWRKDVRWLSTHLHQVNTLS